MRVWCDGGALLAVLPQGTLFGWADAGALRLLL
jgi:hypothetical protein